MDGLPDVLGFKTQRSRENEPMAVVIGKEGPQGLWEGLGLGLGEGTVGGEERGVPECLMCPVCLYPHPA